MSPRFPRAGIMPLTASSVPSWRRRSMPGLPGAPGNRPVRKTPRKRWPSRPWPRRYRSAAFAKPSVGEADERVTRKGVLGKAGSAAGDQGPADRRGDGDEQLGLVHQPRLLAEQLRTLVSVDRGPGLRQQRLRVLDADWRHSAAELAQEPGGGGGGGGGTAATHKRGST